MYIILPKGEEIRVAQLRLKLEEYKGRLSPNQAPELQMDTICKIALLEGVLANEHVVTHELFEELATKYGTGFDGHVFQNACDVISDYCVTGGAHVCGGTGLK